MSEIITEKVHNYIRKGFLLGENIQCHPYTWDDLKNGPQVVKSRSCKLLWYFNAFVTFAHYTFVLVRCIQVNMDKETDISLKLYMRFVCVFFLFPVIFQCFFILNTHDFPVFTCSYLELMRNLKNDLRLENNENKLMTQCHIYMTFIYYGFISLSAMLTLLSFVRPESPELISSVLIIILKRPLTIFEQLFCSGFFVYVDAMYLANAFLIIYSSFGSVFATLKVINDISSWVTPNAFDEQTTRKFLHIYRCIRILLQALHTALNSFLLPPTKIIIICMAIFCTYGAIRLDGFLRFALGAIGADCTIFMCLMFSFVSQFHSRSVAILISIKSLGLSRSISVPVGQRWLGKEFNSLPVLKINVSYFYFVDKGMILVMLKFISEACVNFLLANPA